MLRIAVFVVAIAGLLTFIPTMAAAEGCVVDAGSEQGRFTSSVVVEGACVAHQPGAPSPGAGSPRAAQPVAEGPVVELAYEPSWGTHPDTGELCVDVARSATVTVEDPLGQLWMDRALQMIADPLLADVEFRWCDDTANTAIAADPTAAARDFVRSIPLPTAELTIAPGFALTGQPAYLEVAGQESFTANGAIPGFGGLQATLRPTSIVVDWGDGATEVVADGRTGAAWDGPAEQQILHTYTHAQDQVTVTAQVHWEARWSVGGFTGTVSDLQVVGELDLEVRSLRSVRADPDG